MSALLELAPLTVVSDSTDLDELFFSEGSSDGHPIQNCLVSTICEKGSGTDHCISTQ